MDKFIASTLHFERSLQKLQHGSCNCCRVVSLDLKTNRAGKCSKCAGKEQSSVPLPVWRGIDGKSSSRANR